MKNMFAGLIDYCTEDYEELWNEAIFVVDTNILINFYKFTSKENTSKLFEILTDLKKEGRLWIPHQVALEYFFNYEDNLNKPRQGYNSLGTKVSKILGDIKTSFGNIKSEYSYIDIQEFEFIYEDLKVTNEKFQQQIKEKIDNLPNPHITKNNIYNLLEDIVGQPYEQETINQIEKDGEYRYANNIPPGFEDIDRKEKLGSRIFGNLRYERLYGDLIMWKQIIDHIKQKEEPVPVIFITEDKKKDWWEKEGNKVKRPHPLLIQEFMQETKQKFYMYRTDNFVKYAKEYLNVNVTDDEQESINRDVNNIRQSVENEENYPDLFNNLGKGVNKLSTLLALKTVNDEKDVVSNILHYLDYDEVVRYKKILQEIEEEKEPLGSRLTKLRDALDSAIEAALPNMISEVKQLISGLRLLGGYNEEIDRARYIIKHLPENHIEKVKILEPLLIELHDKYNADFF